MSKIRRTFSRRDFLFVSGSLVGATALAACVTPPAATEGPAEAEPMMEPVEISTWTQDHNEDVRAVISDELLPEFLDMNPDISDVNFEWLPWGTPFFEKLTTSIASNTMPDIWEPALAGFGDVYREGWAIPVDDYIADSDLDKPGRFHCLSLQCVYQRRPTIWDSAPTGCAYLVLPQSGIPGGRCERSARYLGRAVRSRDSWRPNATGTC